MKSSDVCKLCGWAHSDNKKAAILNAERQKVANAQEAACKQQEEKENREIEREAKFKRGKKNDNSKQKQQKQAR